MASCELSVSCPFGRGREAEVVEVSGVLGGPDEHPQECPAAAVGSRANGRRKPWSKSQASARTIRKWIDRYRREELTGLRDHSSGRIDPQPPLAAPHLANRPRYNAALPVEDTSAVHDGVPTWCYVTLLLNRQTCPTFAFFQTGKRQL